MDTTTIHLTDRQELMLLSAGSGILCIPAEQFSHAKGMIEQGILEYLDTRHTSILAPLVSAIILMRFRITDLGYQYLNNAKRE